MIFHKYKLIFTGIPKNASSSVYEVLKNPTDNQHHHKTIIREYTENDAELMESYPNVCIVRNPYDRFISACEQIKRDNHEEGGLDWSLDDVMEKEIYGNSFDNEVFWPQYKFVCFGKKVLMEYVLRYETLDTDWKNFALEYNKTYNTNIRIRLPKSNVSENRKTWQEELKKGNIDTLYYINHRYKLDFEIFGYDMIDKLPK